MGGKLKMAYYRVQLKQGRRTITNRIHAKSVEHCKAFFDELTTMKVTEILEVKYLASDKTIPVDDFNYQSICKVIMKNKDLNMSLQAVINNVKINKSEDDVYNACLKHLDINGSKIDSIVTALFKK